MLLPQPYQYPQLSEGADGVHGQLRGRKEYPFSEVRNQFWQSLVKVMKTMLGVWVVLFCQAHQQFFTHSSDILVAELLLGSKE